MNYKEELIDEDTYKVTLENGNVFYYKINNNNAELASLTFKEKDSLEDKDIINQKINPSESLILVKNYQELAEIIKIIKEVFMNHYMTDIDNLKINIIVNDKNEIKNIESIIKDLDINYTIIENYQEKENNLDEYVDKITASGKSSIVKSEDNEIDKEYVLYNNNIYDNNINSLHDEKKALLQELLQDEKVRNLIKNMTNEELDKLLMERITLDKKKYHMEDADNITYNQDNKESITNTTAFKNDGKYNSELGIIVNSEKENNNYTTIEEHNNNINIVTPEVTTMDISSKEYDSNTGNNKHTIENKEVEQTRDTSKTYYYDDDFNIYDEDFKIIGRINDDGYTINYENNSLLKNGIFIGYLDNIRNYNNDYEIEKENEKNKVKIKKLEKNDNNAFINIYGFIGIIIVLGLIIGLILFIK